MMKNFIVFILQNRNNCSRNIVVEGWKKPSYLISVNPKEQQRWTAATAYATHMICPWQKGIVTSNKKSKKKQGVYDK